MTEPSTGIVRQSENAMVEVPSELSIESLISQVAKVQEAMRAVMKSGEHYGIIPGTDKPTLLKPGAEKLCLLFRLDPQYDITRREVGGGDHIEYEIVCTLYHIPTGQRVGSGVGLCSSMESKYRYRRGTHECPTCGSETIIKGKDEFGGGWLCWRKKGGCGAKFGESTFGDIGLVDNPDIADVFNTVLKMGKKRAMVDAALTATAASDIFTQDLEDMRAMMPKPPQEVSEPGPNQSSHNPPKPEEYPSAPASVATPADEFWKVVNEQNIDRKVAMDALRESGGNFETAMKDINNAD